MFGSMFVCFCRGVNAANKKPSSQADSLLFLICLLLWWENWFNLINGDTIHTKDVSLAAYSWIQEENLDLKCHSVFNFEPKRYLVHSGTLRSWELFLWYFTESSLNTIDCRKPCVGLGLLLPFKIEKSRYLVNWYHALEWVCNKNSAFLTITDEKHVGFFLT